MFGIRKLFKRHLMAKLYISHMRIFVASLLLSAASTTMYVLFSYYFRGTPIHDNALNGISRISRSTCVGCRSPNKGIEIMWINKPVWINLTLENQRLLKSCPFKNCYMTVDRTNAFNKSAIVFSTQDDLFVDPQELKKHRPKKQVWVFLRSEPPTRFNTSWYRDPKWRNTMNWSMGYRLDSDIFWPYLDNVHVKAPEVNKDYRAIFRKKSKFAAWAVSHCVTPGQREIYVNRMQQYGIPIDIFGKCSKKGLHEHGLYDVINRHYKFYLAFENSICKDYVSEKFFKYYQQETVLIVRGGFNYSEHFAPKTFIDTSRFTSIKRLAEYLLKVNRSEELYTEYLRNKDETYFNPSRVFDMSASCYCSLCKKLNNVEESKVYPDIYSYLQKGACSKPKDLT